jgi:hypothetical protein
MQINYGTYNGNGTTKSITGVGFQPDLVIVKKQNDSNAQFKTSSMSGLSSGYIRADSANDLTGITSLDSDGFTVLTNDTVNGNGSTYNYIAIKDNGAGDFKVGSYTGNATDGKAITGVGFQPCYVLIKSDSGIVGASKYAGQTNSSMQFSGSDRSDLIVSLDSDGFTVNDGSGSGANLVNVNAVTHYYFAFKSVAKRITTFSFSGNSTDNTDITTPGFPPGFVLIKGDANVEPKLRQINASYSGDNSQAWDNGLVSNAIQSFSSTNGFQLGTDAAVNSTGTTYNALVLYDPNNYMTSPFPSHFRG